MSPTGGITSVALIFRDWLREPDDVRAVGNDWVNYIKSSVLGSPEPGLVGSYPIMLNTWDFVI